MHLAAQGLNGHKNKNPSLMDERYHLLLRLVADARRRRSITRQQASDIIDHAFSVRERLSPEQIRSIGGVLLKTEAIESMPSDLET